MPILSTNWTYPIWNTWDIETSSNQDVTWYYWNIDATTNTITLNEEELYRYNDYIEEVSLRTWEVWNQNFNVTFEFQNLPSDIIVAGEAKERAEKLLKEHLNEEQKRQLEIRNEFEVEGQSGKKYLITRGRAGNVYSLDEKRRKTHQYCIHPDDTVPDADTMLSQLIWIKWNEDQFLKTANVTKLPLAA